MKDRIKAVRKHLGLNQTDFAIAIGVTRPMLATYELGKVVPRDPVLKSIAATYGVSFDWLKTGSGDMFEPTFATPNTVIDTIISALQGENKTAKALFTALAEFDDRDWETVQKFIDKLKANK